MQLDVELPVPPSSQIPSLVFETKLTTQLSVLIPLQITGTDGSGVGSGVGDEIGAGGDGVP
eukprot:713507-Prymnesium_polylepis.1